MFCYREPLEPLFKLQIQTECETYFKLQMFRIEGMALDWFHSYLSFRFFKFNIGDAYSNWKELNFSVPQGSCAGPSLFNTYSSTVTNCIPKKINVCWFADDHSLQKVFQACDKAGEWRAINEIETCLINIGAWMNKNRLKMN